MRVLVDESLSPKLADTLADEGHECLHVNRIGLRGRPDHIVYQAAQDNEAVLITRDLGFADVTRYRLGEHQGIVAARYPEQITNRLLIAKVASGLQSPDESDIKGNVVIMEPDRTRIRRKKS